MKKAHGRGGLRPPPLNPVRAFCAAARHASFTRAASELGVTQGAVSRAVQALESHLDRVLFRRSAAGGLVLEPGAAEFARIAEEALERIAASAEDFVTRPSGGPTVLTLQAYASFLFRWLVPRLPAFRALHPEIDLRLVASGDGIEVTRAAVDARVRYGRGRWRDTEAVFLFADELRPMCSPACLDPGGAPYDAEVLVEHVILHQRHRHRDWNDWLVAAGRPGLAPHGNLSFEELSIAYECALAGHGVVLAQRRHVARELAEGRLFEPFATELRRETGYFLTYGRASQPSMALVQFREWLVDEARLEKGEARQPAGV
jgi:LysR family glycine cleavage system transcriptional activator